MTEKINHPQHYGGDTMYEAIKVIEAWQLGFCLGNTVKYISRAGKKNPAATIEDLEKAKWYLDREIAAAKERAIPTSAVQGRTTFTLGVPLNVMEALQLLANAVPQTDDQWFVEVTLADGSNVVGHLAGVPMGAVNAKTTIEVRKPTTEVVTIELGTVTSIFPTLRPY